MGWFSCHSQRLGHRALWNGLSYGVVKGPLTTCASTAREAVGGARWHAPFRPRRRHPDGVAASATPQLLSSSLRLP